MLVGGEEPDETGTAGQEEQQTLLNQQLQTTSHQSYKVNTTQGIGNITNQSWESSFRECSPGKFAGYDFRKIPGKLP